MVKRVRGLGEPIGELAKLDRPQIDYTYNVLDSKETNAVACPGGWIYAFKGLVRAMPEDEELAAVLAHESAHVSERHGMQALERALGWSLLLGLAGGDSDLGGAVLGLIMNGYSRKQEAEADKVGQIYLFKAGYDIGAMARMLRTLHGDKAESGEGFEKYLSTHPSGVDRIRAAEERELDILLELGHLQPVEDMPRLAVVYQRDDEDAETSELGEQLATMVMDTLNATGRYRVDFAGLKTSDPDERVADLLDIADDKGTDGAVGLVFTEPPKVTEGGKTVVRLSLDMTLIAAGEPDPVLVHSIATAGEARKANASRMIATSVQTQSQQAARAVARTLLDPRTEEEPDPAEE